MLFTATGMACGFITFYSLPDVLTFLVMLTMMVAMQTRRVRPCGGRRQDMRNETATTEPWQQSCLSKDYEAMCETTETWLYIAMTGLMLRRLAYGSPF